MMAPATVSVGCWLNVRDEEEPAVMVMVSDPVFPEFVAVMVLSPA